MAQKRKHTAPLKDRPRYGASVPSLARDEIQRIEQLEPGKNPLGIVGSQEAVAKVFGVDPRTVAHWVKSGMPYAHGKYDLVEIRAWRALRAKRHSAGKTKSGSVGWEGEFRKFKAQLEEIKLKKAQGELIERAVVERELVQISLTVKRAFLTLPRQVAPQLVGLEPRQIEVLMSTRIREIIEKFADSTIFHETKNSSIADSNDLEQPH